jgi:hypothetical protein
VRAVLQRRLSAGWGAGRRPRRAPPRCSTVPLPRIAARTTGRGQPRRRTGWPPATTAEEDPSTGQAAVGGPTSPGQDRVRSRHAKSGHECLNARTPAPSGPNRGRTASFHPGCLVSRGCDRRGAATVLVRQLLVHADRHRDAVLARPPDGPVAAMHEVPGFGEVTGGGRRCRGHAAKPAAGRGRAESRLRPGDAGVCGTRTACAALT